MNKLSMHAFLWGMNQAQELARQLGVVCHAIDVHQFPDGETLVTVQPSAGTTIIYAELNQPDEKLFSLVQAADALRRNGASRIILVAPYLCYMRQDKMFVQGQAVSQHVLGRILPQFFDRIITVEAHLHRVHVLKEVFKGIEAESYSAAPPIAAFMRQQHLTADTIVMGPDEESTPFVAAIADMLGLLHQVATKTRHGDHEVTMTLAAPQDIKGHPVVIVDDIISSGGTVLKLSQLLQQAGASRIDVIVVHALFPESNVETIKRGGVQNIYSTTSVPHSTNAISLTEFLVGALKKEITP